jgi:hypothetical protein
VGPFHAACPERTNTPGGYLSTAVGTLLIMCRNIRTLHNFEPPATKEEVRDAALQYVRKISGSTKPSQANAEAFERAVDDVARVTAHLLDELVTTAPPKNREVEAAKRRARAAERYAA